MRKNGDYSEYNKTIPPIVMTPVIAIKKTTRILS